MAAAIIINGQITTTEAKAKFAKVHVEKLITAAKSDRLGKNRVIASSVGNKAFQRLIGEIAPGFGKRFGGYTRITKLMPRRGDSAQMARIELLEWEKIKEKEIKEKKPKVQNITKKIKTAKSVESKTKSKLSKSKKPPKTAVAKK